MKYVIKRFMDLLLTIIALVLLFPLLFTIYVAIKLDSEGPALFKQERLTKDGMVFTMYKFRTMIVNAEQMGTGLFNFTDDFRVTKVGKFLRKSSLDELPQLFNILKGDMSIVGPRPPVSYELGSYEDLNDDYKRRFTVLPGITGLAQVSGRNELEWDKKVEYDNLYIKLFEKYGVLIDFKIIFLSVLNVFRMKGIYEVKDKKLENALDEEIAQKATETVLEKARANRNHLISGGNNMNNNAENRLVWLNGNIVSLQDATINILSPTAQFGANVFEGIRCYWNEDAQNLYAFRLSDHYNRLKNSMKMFRMESKYSVDELRQGFIDVVRANEYKEDIAVRQTVFIDGFGSWMSKGPVSMFIAPAPKSRITDISKAGMKCCVSSWERISDRNISPKVKVGANYINSRMAQIEALENGYDSAIFMNNQGKIAEGPGSCFFIVRDGVLITPPVTASVLESITRDTIIDLARNVLHIKTIERDIDRTELYVCDEAFLCGSAMEVCPVLNIDGIAVGEGNLGKITQAVHDTYLLAVMGEIESYKMWGTGVY